MRLLFKLEVLLYALAIISLAAGSWGSFWLCFLTSCVLTPIEAWLFRRPR